ncbi:hypothetical protein BLNAU_13775 [Blattamonas nauphoetae]|uniref:B30.2/SPRY domain-containing protein n=1 Tax=Blattamonas nauphoetae TaxID=2049346 RepID=A0ABQ9XIX9_9EUKA|nr:hypothetical protein BLNAU_13775 [Blattamonas nauphoetae]
MSDLTQNKQPEASKFIGMLSNPDNSLTTVIPAGSTGDPSSDEKKELFEKVGKLETESDEIRIGISKELVNLCLDDSGNKKGIAEILMEGRILPILGNQLSLSLGAELRVGFQVLFETILAVISKNEVGSLSKHFPSLLALSQDTNARISEPAISTIGLITHRLSCESEVEVFLQSGIVEWLVSSLRTHPDAMVRCGMVVALGEIGIGLKMAVVRAEREQRRNNENGRDSPRSAKQEGTTKNTQLHQTANTSQSAAQPLRISEDGRERGREERVGVGRRGVWVSSEETEALSSVSWEREDTGATDFVGRCVRGIGVVRAGLIGVLRGWDGESERRIVGSDGGSDGSGREKKDEKKEEEETGTVETRRESSVVVKEVAGSVCGVVFAEVFGVMGGWCREGVIGVRGSDFESVQKMMSSKMEEQRKSFEAELNKKMLEMERQLQNEREQAKKEREQAKREKDEMEQLIAELRQNQRPILTVVSEIKSVFSNSTTFTRTGNTFKITNYTGNFSTVTLDHSLSSGIWQLTLRIIQRTSGYYFGVGFIDSTEGPYPDQQYIGWTNTSLSFCSINQRLHTCHKGQSYTSHGSGLVSFTTDDEVVLEVDMVEHTCHLFVNSVQTKVFARGIPASVKLAVSFYGSNDGFEVKSFKEVEKSSAVTFSDEVLVDF